MLTLFKKRSAAEPVKQSRQITRRGRGDTLGDLRALLAECERFPDDATIELRRDTSTARPDVVVLTAQVAYTPR
ncbi:MAG TPA: hypothetical protein VIQ30_23740 [Pseudonocardia sp.]